MFKGEQGKRDSIVVVAQLSPEFTPPRLVGLNGEQAAMRAGYSPDTARFIGHENLTKPYIQLAITEARQKQQDRIE